MIFAVLMEIAKMQENQKQYLDNQDELNSQLQKCLNTVENCNQATAILSDNLRGYNARLHQIEGSVSSGLNTVSTELGKLGVWLSDRLAKLHDVVSAPITSIGENKVS